MKNARKRALITIALTLIAGLAGAIAIHGRGPERFPDRPPNERPNLLLLTSLPLIFGEDFSLQQNGSPVLSALNRRYHVLPISVTDEKELAKGRLLLMAHPLAQPAEDLVALDAWVRRGGKLLLFADPLLEWQSSRPLGDPLRPPPMFMDTGLLEHWGLRLDSPEQRGRRFETLGSYDVLTDSPGALFGNGCEISRDRLVASCKIGRGRAVIVADADLLDAARLGPEARKNLDAVLEELAKLEQP